MFFLEKRKERDKKKEGGPFRILLKKVSLPPFIHELSLNIPQGAWIYLPGKNELKALTFCDLCFGFLKPKQGSIETPLSGHDVSFLGCAVNTYGNTLLERLTYTTTNVTKKLLLETIEQVLSKELLDKISKENTHLAKLDKDISSISFTEKEHLEILEANSILQNRKVALIKTDSEFYQRALKQGFKHSKLFLNSGKTIFWVGYDVKENYAESKNSQKSERPTLCLDFACESPLLYTN